ncbi:hypothetical protein M5K25_006169 [Dendrobium thyrsiflorum]|uniref:Uncharacterized protein n=1 Tax=Dendrobium thyrsiflorum TaxID=117978 RepID=A0ABD0VAT0_DENTH
MLPGFRSRWTRGSGLVWWRKRRPVAISAAMRNLCCQGIGGVLFRRKSRSSKLPFAMYSYTRQPYSGQAPRSSTILGCRMQLRTSTCRRKTVCIGSEYLNSNRGVIQKTFIHRTITTLTNLKILSKVFCSHFNLVYRVSSVPNSRRKSIHCLPLLCFS